MLRPQNSRGIRASGSVSWVNDSESMTRFMDYETKVNLAIQNARIMAVCTYPAQSAALCQCRELIHNHGKIFIKRGEWVHDKSKDAASTPSSQHSLLPIVLATGQAIEDLRITFQGEPKLGFVTKPRRIERHQPPTSGALLTIPALYRRPAGPDAPPAGSTVSPPEPILRVQANPAEMRMFRLLARYTTSNTSATIGTAPINPSRTTS